MFVLMLPPSSALSLFTRSACAGALLSFLVHFSVLFVALKRFPQPAAIWWPGAALALPPSTGEPKPARAPSDGISLPSL